MSLRRRLFLLGLAVVVVGLATLVVTRGGDPAGGVPVVVVPGYGGDARSVADLVAALRRTRVVEVAELPDRGTGDVRRSAAALDRLVGDRTVDVVGYSAGGVVVRWWLRFLGGTAQARRVVTLGSPHHGTTLADRLGGASVADCTGACAQLRPGSGLLRALNAGDETPEGPAYTAVWTARDETVTPPESAVLAGATNVRAQDCGADVAHGGLVADPTVAALVARALTGAAADC